jgi:hypothetical protein
MPLIQSDPLMGPFVMQLLQFSLAGFKIGKKFEGELDRTFAAIQKKLENPQPQPNPEQQKVQAELQMEKEVHQMDMQGKQADLQVKKQENQIKLQGKQQDLQMKREEMGMKRQEQQQKHELSMEDQQQKSQMNRAAFWQKFQQDSMARQQRNMEKDVVGGPTVQ